MEVKTTMTLQRDSGGCVVLAVGQSMHGEGRTRRGVPRCDRVRCSNARCDTSIFINLFPNTLTLDRIIHEYILIRDGIRWSRGSLMAAWLPWRLNGSELLFTYVAFRSLEKNTVGWYTCVRAPRLSVISAKENTVLQRQKPEVCQLFRARWLRGQGG